MRTQDRGIFLALNIVERLLQLTYSGIVSFNCDIRASLVCVIRFGSPPSALDVNTSTGRSGVVIVAATAPFIATV